MARIKHGNFEYDDTLGVNDILEQHERFSRKLISEEKEREFQERISKEKEIWSKEQNNRDFANQIGDENNRKIVSTLLDKGFSQQEIKEQFPNLIGEAKQPTNQDQPVISINDILKGQATQFDTSLKDKKVSEMTPQEKVLWIKQRAKEREIKGD